MSPTAANPAICHGKFKEGTTTMLIYTRRVGQTLTISNRLVITVLNVESDHVRMCIDLDNTFQFIFSSGVGQTLNIDDDTSVTVLVSKGGHTRLGVDVAINTPVYREEIQKLISWNEIRLNLCDDNADRFFN
ncbi:MAG: carbon storage regulator [Gammaproteobacteria bacterium]|nr:carbon storage regulator [Gammaproteobacteria bacterium]